MFGKLVEQELLGVVKKEAPAFGQLREVETTYLGYKPSLEYVKTHQRGDPYHPKRFFPRSLLEALKGSKELEIKNDTQLGYYTAIGSALDQYHGIDAFFEYTNTNGKTIRVTIDVTTNPHKDSYKADVIFAIPKGGLDPNDENYNTLISQYVEQVEADILTKI